MKDNKEKNNELFNQATELIKQLIMRNEHMYKDIAKMQRIINTKNIKRMKKKKKKQLRNFMYVKLQKYDK